MNEVRAQVCVQEVKERDLQISAAVHERETHSKNTCTKRMLFGLMFVPRSMKKHKPTVRSAYKISSNNQLQ